MQAGVASTNLAAAMRLIELAWQLGVREFSAGGGSRNSPILAVLGLSPQIRTWSFVDERSAAFFSLGRARSLGAPVAVVTTSGTAAAELLPATVEAHYSGVPLLLITADRPARFRGTGAPQAIEQPGIFGSYVERSIDLDAAAADLPPIPWSRERPLHINIAFDEPLIDGPQPSVQIDRAPAVAPRIQDKSTDVATARAKLSSWRSPLLLVSSLNPQARESVVAFARRFGAPVYAESASGLREDRRLDPLMLRSGERILQRGKFDGVLRIGGVPTARFWRDLEESRRDLAVINISSLPFAGVSRGILLSGRVETILEELGQVSRVPDSALFPEDRKRLARFHQLLDAEPTAELTMVRHLSRLVATDSLVFLGNSLPIREWDLAADRESRGIRVAANRGANGIDGQLSTFFGMCEPSRDNWTIIGDLTTLYDLNAPWIVPQLDPAIRFRVVIINNSGGRIFSRVPSLRALAAGVRERLVECSHDLGFEEWASMWRMAYLRWESVPSQLKLPQRVVIELLPSGEASRRLWEAYDRMWSSD